MGQANLKARRREERVEEARKREAAAAEAGPDAGELPVGPELRPEQIEYWQAQVGALQARLREVVTKGTPDIQVRVQVTGPAALAIITQSGPVTAQALVTADGARQIAAMILEGADRSEDPPESPQGLATPPAALWTPGNGRGG